MHAVKAAAGADDAQLKCYAELEQLCGRPGSTSFSQQWVAPGQEKNRMKIMPPKVWGLWEGRPDDSASDPLT